MKKTLSWVSGILMASAAVASTPVSGNDVALKFNPENSTVRELVMPDGKTVRYRAYEHIYYVTNVEDSAYQYLNFYVPEAVVESGVAVPIFLRTYVGGYMAARAMEPSSTDATGRALAEGYALCIPGSRGHNSVVERNGEQTYTGRAPRGLLDLKAAIRYLRLNDSLMPGDAERIITDGTSAGGAMSSLLGATGNSPLYEPYLKAMGAAEARDDVFAAVCYCPITDLDHADMAYEWLYSCTNTGVRQLSDEQQQVSEELAAAYPAYLNSLQLRRPDDGTLLTADNYLDYVKSFIIRSAQRAKNEGCDIPTDIGIKFNEKTRPNLGGMQAGAGRPQGNGHARGGHPQSHQGDQRQAPSFGPQGGPVFQRSTGEFVIDVDMPAYLSYVATTQALKTPPAFDAQGVLTDRATAENSVFGDDRGGTANFTAYSLGKATGSQEPDADMQKRVYLMNPMNFIGDGTSKQAPHWYIRHGARDRDTGFSVSINLATKLMNNGLDVDFALPWNRPHSGDYNLDDLFAWLRTIVK